MNGDHHSILAWVKDAKEDMQAADEMIKAYMPFIHKETAKFMKRPVDRDNDDELSIAMIAFYEAIQSYSLLRGSFLAYAALHIRSRLIDYARKEKKHREHLSLDAPEDEDDEKGAPINSLADKDDIGEKRMAYYAAKEEVEEFSAQILTFGISLTDVSEHCPKQQRTLDACAKALEFVKQRPAILDEFLRTKKLPISLISEGSQVERKTLERHRKYMVALLLAYTNGYEIIRGHLKGVLKSGGDGK